MNLRPGSLLWLAAHDVKVSWRRFLDMFGRLSTLATWGICLGGIIVLHLVAWRIMVLLPRLKPELGHAISATGAVFVLFVLAWMTAQGLLGMARTLLERGGMDLMLASPLPVRVILASRLASTAMSSFGSVALLALPLANMAAILYGAAWLAVYPTLLALAMIGTLGGAVVAICLFLWCDPRRVRAIAQLCAAVIGGAFLLAMQVSAMLPSGARGAVADYLARSNFAALLEPAVAAASGDPASLATLIASAAVLFVAASLTLSRSFLRASLRAAGAAAETDGPRAAADHRLSFGAGVAKSLRRKEWRLLRRDHSVFAQLSLQIIYTVPLAVVLLRSADNMPLAMALSPTIVVIAAQVAASLAWITVSGEDAPELIAAAPVSRAEVEAAKIAAIGVPVSIILAPALLGLALVSPHGATLVALFASAAALSTALINLWHPMPGNRRGMLRRHSQSKLMALLEHLLAMLWGVAVFVALLGSAAALVPIALVVAILASLRPATRRSARNLPAVGARV
jgi:ABC-2 type transport system permease protein